jgi:DNA-binding NarL/FixJ family response regulator
MRNPNPARPRPQPARVFVVDDHPVVRERLGEAIADEPGFTVCGSAEDRSAALAAIRAARPDIVIVDLTLKNSSGFDLIRDLRAAWPDLAILVVSMHDDTVHAERALHAGARGYITKQEATRNILLALKTVRRGRIYLSEPLARTLARRAAGRPRVRPGLSIDRLSEQEFRVFQLLGRGFTIQQIAEKLGLDHRTVVTYRARIQDKLNFKDPSELLRHAIHWDQTPGGG